MSPFGGDKRVFVFFFLLHPLSLTTHLFLSSTGHLADRLVAGRDPTGKATLGHYIKQKDQN